jgi:hypothetical protein
VRLRYRYTNYRGRFQDHPQYVEERTNANRYPNDQQRPANKHPSHAAAHNGCHARIRRDGNPNNDDANINNDNNTNDHSDINSDGDNNDDANINCNTVNSRQGCVKQIALQNVRAIYFYKEGDDPRNATTRLCDNLPRDYCLGHPAIWECALQPITRREVMEIAKNACWWKSIAGANVFCLSVDVWTKRNCQNFQRSSVEQKES